MEVSPKRLTYIDAARTYAILLALLAHALITTGVFKELGDNSLYIKQFTRMATPMFVFMFGFMVEFVYVNRASTYGVKSITGRLYVRSFQCYVAYMLTSLCGFLGGFRSFEAFVDSLIFLTYACFGNILIAYSIMLLLTPFIVKLRMLLGIRVLYIALVILLAEHIFAGAFKSIDFGFLNYPINMLLGIGMGRGGPSVIGAFIFYLSGMIVAASVNRSNLDPKGFYKSISYVFIIMLGFGIVVIHEDLLEVWKHFADFHAYRKHNAPEYYIIGTSCCLLSIAVFYIFIGEKTLSKPLALFLPIGTSSLISYTVGNMLLNLSLRYARDINPFIFLLVFFSAVLVITRNIRNIPFYKNASALMNLEYRLFQRTSISSQKF